MNKHIAIIGAGAAGYTMALEAKKQNIEVTLIESNTIGGLCMNQGCIPTKYYLNAIQSIKMLDSGNDIILNQAQQKKLFKETEDVISRLSYGEKYNLNKSDVEIVFGEAKVLSCNQVEIKTSEGKKRIDVDSVIIATGSRPKEVYLSSEYKIYSTDDLFVDNFPANMPEKDFCIIGGGITGVECAIIMKALGKNVSLIEMRGRILPSMDEDISERMTYQLETLGINVKTKCVVPTEDAVLFCLGRRAVVPELGVDIEFDYTENGCIGTDKYMETSVPGIFAIGDCNGVSMEVSDITRQTQMAIKKILGNNYELEDNENDELANISRCVYGPLEGISVGMTEDQAKSIKGKYSVKFADTNLTGSALIEKDQMGFVKVICEKKTEIIKGMHILAPNAHMYVPFAQLAILKKATLSEIKNLPYLHPTSSEVFREL